MFFYEEEKERFLQMTTVQFGWSMSPGDRHIDRATFMDAARKLGLGAGWDQRECDAYGISFPGPKQRVEELEEALQIIKAMWKGEEATV